LEGTEGSQAVESKCKKIAARDEEEQRPFKKARRKQQWKYCGSTIVKMEGANLCKRYVSTGQDCLVYSSR